MMKRITALALALALLLSLTTAFAWSCPACGSEMGGKFCTECGTKKPANVCPSCGTDFGDQLPKFCTECGTKLAEATAPKATATPVPQVERAVITDIVSNGDGTVTVSWMGGKAPYKVQYTLKESDDFAADRAAAQALGAYWNGATDVAGQSATLSRLVPGEEYWIAVLDANEKGQRWSYTSETTEFADFETSLMVSPRAKTGETTEDLICIPADSAGVADDTQHGVYMRLNYRNPGKTRKLMMQIVLTFANGFKYVNGVGEMEFTSGEERWWEWQFHNTDALLAHMRSYAGSLPEGDVTVDVYLDGKLAGSGVIPMRTMVPVTIIGVTDRNDGKYVINWADNGYGPYDVHYFQRFTDDMEADRRDARGTGWWNAGQDVTGTTDELNALVPGKSYWLTVTDSQGTVGAFSYDVPEAGDAGLDMTIQQALRKSVNGTCTDLETFSAAALNGDYTEEYGLYLELFYTNPAKEVSKPAQWVMTLPDGVVFCEYGFDLNLYASGSTYWDCYTLDWAFGRVKAWYGEVLQGEYRFDLYVEGDHAAGTTFTVDE